MEAFSSPALIEVGKKYYFYAKCEKSGSKGVFYLSETAIDMNADPNYYNFLYGLLNSEYEENRSFIPLHGFTEILPGQINTSLLKDPDNNLVIDLQNKIIEAKGTAVLRGCFEFYDKDGTAKTLIKGGKIVSEALDVNILKAKELLTADSGKRITINYGGSIGLGNNAILMYGNDSPSPRLKVSGEPMKLTYQEPLQAAIYNKTDAIYTSKQPPQGEAELELASFSVGSFNNIVKIPALNFGLSADYDGSTDEGSQADLQAELRIIKDGVVSVMASGRVWIRDNEASEAINVSVAEFNGTMQNGSYKIVLYYNYLVSKSIQGIGTSRVSVGASPSTPTIDINYINELTQIGTNGLAVESRSDKYFVVERKENGMLMEMRNGEHFLRVSENGVEGTGVLAAGRVSYSGSYSARWGTKINNLNWVSRIEQGKFRCYHNIGHTDYFITATAVNSTSCCCTIAAKTSTYIDIYLFDQNGNPKDSDFEFMAVGQS